ncbi:MAG: hypothetical protein L0H59_13325, partial [Tomitella sp.]|nr:hypothetical protein [Tomitella sp.]
AFAFMADRRASTAGGGIRFTEQMHSSPTTAEPAIRLHLAGHIPSLNRFLTDPEHTINVEGTIELPRRTPARTRGTMRLFPRSSSAIMLYDLEFTDDRDHPSALTGSKTLRGRGLLALLRSLTTLDTELTHSGTRQRTSTTLTIRPRHVVHLLQSIAGEGFTGPRRACTRLRFVAFFARSTLRSVWKRNCQSSDQGLSEASAHAEH